MKETNRQLEVVLWFLSKKVLFGENRPFWTRKWHILIIRNGSKNFFFFKKKQVHENHINGFSEKILFQDKWIIQDPKWRILTTLVLLYGLFYNFTQSKGPKSHGFSKKNLMRGNLVILTQKWYVLITLDLLPVLLFKFCTIKGAKGYMKILLVVF